MILDVGLNKFHAKADFVKWQEEILFEEIDKARYSIDCLESATRQIRLDLEYMILRDTGVFSLVEDLSAEDPERVIIIMRGFGHRGMANFFDLARYDLTIKEKEFIINDFRRDAIDENFRNRLTEDMIKSYAKLFLDFVRAFNQSGRPLLFLNRLGMRMAGNLLIKRARQHALENNPAIAQELGYAVKR